jgi:hypothetical protein
VRSTRNSALARTSTSIARCQRSIRFRATAATSWGWYTHHRLNAVLEPSAASSVARSSRGYHPASRTWCHFSRSAGVDTLRGRARATRESIAASVDHCPRCTANSISRCLAPVLVFTPRARAVKSDPTPPPASVPRRGSGATGQSLRRSPFPDLTRPHRNSKPVLNLLSLYNGCRPHDRRRPNALPRRTRRTIHPTTAPTRGNPPRIAAHAIGPPAGERHYLPRPAVDTTQTVTFFAAQRLICRDRHLRENL